MSKKEKNTIPSGFDDILGNIYSNAEIGEGVTDMNALMEPNTPLEEDDTINVPPVKDPEDGNTADPNDDPNAQEDTTPEPPLRTQEPTVEEPIVDNTGSGEPSDDDVAEAQQVGLLFDEIGTRLGWNMNDIDENDRPLNVEQLAQYFTDVVNQNSVPQYADERIQQLDEFVKNGGKFEDFYSKQQEALTLENIDLEDENNQKAVVREFMQRAGYSDEQINRKISRYEDSDVLYDEAEDALGRLKEIRQHEVEEATRKQEEQARINEEQSRAFFADVSTNIKNLTNIRGINVPKEDRQALFDYIFKVDQSGQSQYTKDFNKNLVKNLIESAYFTMKADSLISTAKRDGESSAAEKLRKLMRHSTKNHSTYNADERQKSVTDMLNGMF